MSSYPNTPDITAAIILNQVEAQLDGTTSVVKIPKSTFVGVSHGSQDIIKQTVSAVLGHEVAFYLDHQSDKRVYLANLESIRLLRPCEAKIVPGSPLPVLFWTGEVTSVLSGGGIQQPNVQPLIQHPDLSLPMPPPCEQISAERARGLVTPGPSPEAQTEPGAPRRKKRKTKSENPRPSKEQEPWKLKAGEPIESHRAAGSGSRSVKRKKKTWSPSDFQDCDVGELVAQQTPQLYQLGPPCSEYMSQPPSYVTPQLLPQSNQASHPSYDSMPLNSVPSSYTAPGYPAQSVGHRTLEDTSVNQFGRMEYRQGSDVVGNFGLDLPYVPLDNNTVESRIKSWYPELADPPVQTVERPAQKITLPPGEVAPAMPQEAPNAGGGFADENFWNFVNFSDVGVPSAGGMGQPRYDMAHIPGEEALGMPQVVADDDFWKLMNFHLPPPTQATE
ncbi:hypothetical protein F4678DRAFT_463271 [Xylaria arbuscula]|nr:hypothetical protein F4678DRAFT_463271 [Xylaria arbuscula]